MNDQGIFGSVSSEMLPPGYGDIPDSKVQSIHEEEPKVEAETPSSPHHGTNDPDEYGKIWDVFKKDGSDSNKERGAFWQNLVGSLKGDAPDYVIRSGKDDYTYQQNSDGSIVVLAYKGSTTASGHNVGKTYAAGSKAAARVEELYGPYTEDEAKASQRTERATAIGTGLGSGVSQLLPTLAAFLGPQEVTSYDIEEVEDVELGGVSWGLIVGGVVIVGAIGTVLYLAVRDDEE